MWYTVYYELYGYNNSFTCQSYPQYSNFIAVMEENFGDQFKVCKIMHS